MWIKICGIRDVETARCVTALAPDAVGLNFYAQTPRQVSSEVAAQIVDDLPERTEAIGLFVNHTFDEASSIIENCRLSSVQFHGDESPEFLHAIQERFPSIRLIRAFRLGDNGLSELESSLTVLREKTTKLWGCLVDAHVKGAYGGTGKKIDAEILADHEIRDCPRLILAGGLNPGNVADAIRLVRPFGVDVSSGVESSPGKKDLALVEEFIRNARAAFQEIEANTVND